MRLVLVGFWLALAWAGSGLPTQFCPSYSLYETPQALALGGCGVGFATHNFCLYGRDTVSYDRRDFDLFGRLGLGRGLELGLKHSSPGAGLLSLKYQLLGGYIPFAIQLGAGYMKATLANYWTYYVFDLYPRLLASWKGRPGLELYSALKFIHSLYSEETGRETKKVFSYGGTIGVALGPDYFRLMPEVNRLYGSDQGKRFTVTQFGLGAILYY